MGARSALKTSSRGSRRSSAGRSGRASGGESCTEGGWIDMGNSYRVPVMPAAMAGPHEDGEAAYQSGDLKGVVDNAPAAPLSMRQAVVTRRHHYLGVEWRRQSMSVWIAF